MLFPKFQIPSRTPANLANPANLRAENGEISKISSFSNSKPTVRAVEAKGHEVLELVPDPQMEGIAVGSVLREFPGAKVISGWPYNR